MATAPKQSLAEFAFERSIPPCRVCAVGEDRTEADAGLRNGIRKGLVIQWLNERGHDKVTEHAMETHTKKRHHMGDIG